MHVEIFAYGIWIPLRYNKIDCGARGECNMNWFVFIDFDPSKILASSKI